MTDTTNQRNIVSVGLNGRSLPMWRYKDELHLPDHQRAIVSRDDLRANDISTCCGAFTSIDELI